PAFADRRDFPGDGCDVVGEGGCDLRLRRCGEGMLSVAEGAGMQSHCHRDRSDLCATGGDGGISGLDAGRCGGDGGYFYYGDVESEHYHGRSSLKDEGQGDRGEYRAL